MGFLTQRATGASETHPKIHHGVPDTEGYRGNGAFSFSGSREE